MKKVRKFIASPAVTLGAFALAVCLLAFSTIGGTRAALTYFSDNYVSTMQLHELGVVLVENGEDVARGHAATAAQGGGSEEGALLQHLTAEGEPFKLGVEYPEALAVHNPTDTAQGGEKNITEYVRVTVRRYWTKYDTAAGGWVKVPEMDSNLIDLQLLAGNGWVIDESATTEERTVLYYTAPLAPGGTTVPFSSTLCISPDVGVTVEQRTEQENGYTVIYNTYYYDGAAFVLDVQVDAVQDHNAADAILSAWGRKVTINADKTLSLV